MTGGASQRVLTGIDEFVELFDHAWSRGTEPDLTSFLPDRSHPQFAEILIELVRVDLECRWERGNPKPLGEYLATFPGLLHEPAALNAIAFEEYRARRRARQPVTADDYAEQYGIFSRHWPIIGEGGSDAPRDEACGEVPRNESHSTSRFAAAERGPDTISFPAPGSAFENFQLLNELGRGAFSRVYLARQGDLSHRLVVLKISTQSFIEADKLARLQHTNIVPLYSVHRVGNLCAACMPYFGATTVADALDNIRRAGSLPASGKAIVDTVTLSKIATLRSRGANTEPLDTAPVEAPSAEAPSTAGGPSNFGTPDPSAAKRPQSPAKQLQTLAKLTYVDSVLWIGARIAAGLAHAHEQGILHRDLKPANILLADDGRPMLLDFNLAEDLPRGTGASSLAPSHARSAMVGGTLPYMAPEQLLAFHRQAADGDERSDLYSLGVVLYELLAGALPHALPQGPVETAILAMIEDRRTPPPSLRKVHQAVTPAVEAIVLRCLEPDPINRYQSAAKLQEDLDRHLENLPLRHTHEPLGIERAKKWVRRHPRLTSAASITATALVVIAGIVALLVARGQKLAALEAEQMRGELHRAARSAQVMALDAAMTGTDESAAILTSCQSAFDHFGILDRDDWQQHGPFQSLSDRARQLFSQDAQELFFLVAAMKRLEAEKAAEEDRRRQLLREALQWNDRAVACEHVEPRLAVLHQRAAILSELGESAESRRTLEQASQLPSTSDQDGMLACSYTLERRFRKALPHWQRACSGDPQNVFAQFGLACCYEQLGKSAEAAACLTACIALEPMHADWYFRRGVAYLHHKQYPLAAADFDQLLTLDPQRIEGYINRAIARLGDPAAPVSADAKAEYAAAIDDLQAALHLGNLQAEDQTSPTPKSRIYFLLAQARAKSGDTAGAARDRKAGLDVTPVDDAGWVAHGIARLPKDPHAAIADFNRALEHNAHSLAAFESKAHVLSERLGKTAEAIEVLDRAISFHPEHASLIAARGVLLARLGRTTPALADEQRAFADAQRALADAQRALALEPSPETRYQIACIYALLAKREPAHRQRALKQLALGQLALEQLAIALRHGFGSDLLASDPDLAPLRADPQFRQLEGAARILLQKPPAATSVQ